MTKLKTAVPGFDKPILHPKFRKLVTESGLNEDHCYLYALARAMKIDTMLFPESFHRVFKDLSDSEILQGKYDDSFVSDWVKLWPTEAQTGLPYRVSGSEFDCKKKFLTFFKLWPKKFPEMKDYTHEEIVKLVMEVTVEYLQDREDNNWEFCKKNYKFIDDRDGSMLARLIEDRQRYNTLKKGQGSIFINS